MANGFKFYIQNVFVCFLNSDFSYLIQLCGVLLSMSTLKKMKCLSRLKLCIHRCHVFK